MLLLLHFCLILKGDKVCRNELKVMICMWRWVEIIGEKKVKQVLERRGINIRIRKWVSVIVAKGLGIRRGITQTESIV